MPFLDKSLKDSLGGFKPPFSDGDWAAMENVLDARKKRAATLPFRVAGLAMVIGASAFATWYIAVERPTDNPSYATPAIQKTENVVADVPTLGATDEQSVVVVQRPVRSNTPSRRIEGVTPPQVLQQQLVASLPLGVSTELVPLGPDVISSGTEVFPESQVWPVEVAQVRPTWRLHFDGGPALAFAHPIKLGHTAGVGLSLEFTRGWRAVVGMALSKFSLPGSKKISDMYATTPVVTLTETRFSVADFSLNFEHDLTTSGRLRPYVYAGTTVMAPLKETYVYEATGFAMLAPESNASLTYNGLDAMVGGYTAGEPKASAPDYALQPYVGVVNVGVGLAYDVTETTSITGKAQLQKAFGPIGLEDQSYAALATQFGFRFRM